MNIIPFATSYPPLYTVASISPFLRTHPLAWAKAARTRSFHTRQVSRAHKSLENAVQQPSPFSVTLCQPSD